MVCGIVTNGGVASTLRDAHVRGLAAILLADGCAAFCEALHDKTVDVLSSIGPTMSCAEAVRYLESGEPPE